jgi:hypothetical protein
MVLEKFIISVYCLVEEFLSTSAAHSRLRTRGPQPKLSDAEVITMELVGEFLGRDTDKGIWAYFRQHWLAWFPSLGSRAQFAKQAANLWSVKQSIQTWLSQKMGAFTDSIHLVDGVPIPVCHFARARQCRRFRGEAGYGYCAAKKQTYYGFHGHLSVSFGGVITAFSATVASGSERETLWELVPGTHGLYLADKGYLSAPLQQQLRQEAQIDLQTPLRDNMVDTRSPEFVSLLIRERRRIETVLGQLAERFHLAKVWARDLWHFTQRIARKLLAHTCAVFLNGSNGLQLDALIHY